MDKMVVVKKIPLSFFSFAMLVFICMGAIDCKGDEMRVIIEKPTELLSQPEEKNISGNSVISILDKGVRATVIHTRYSKDFMFFKIRTEDGRVGYVMFGDNIKIIADKFR